MIPFSLRPLSVLLLGTTLILSACKKDDDNKDDPQPVTPGVIMGRINPAGSITVVTASDSASHTFSTTPDGDGSYTLRDVVPGTYRIRYTAVSGRITPAVRTAIIVSADTVDLGETRVLPGNGAIGGTGEYRIDNQPVVSEGMIGSLTVGLLQISFSNSGGISIALDNVTGVGTYPLTGNSSGSFGFADAPGFCGTWSTQYGGTGAVTITRYDTAARLVSGTFSFTAALESGPGISNCSSTLGSTIGVTNGTFTDVPF